MHWREYQDKTAEFFRSLGCEAEVDVLVKGVRGEHKIDVWVRFRRFGLETKWVVECKFWNTAVTKEKVMALRSIVEDVGADRGILISSAGFQSGAIRAAQNSNLTLTSLEKLEETSAEDLLASVLNNLETKATELKYSLHNLYTSEKTGPNSWVSKPLPGVDGRAVFHAIANLTILELGFDRIRLASPPYPIAFDESGERTIATSSLQGFVEQASRVIADAQSIIESKIEKRNCRQ